MDIDGLGEKLASRLLEEGQIADVGDIYDLEEEQLVGLEGFGELSARNLLAAIRGSRDTPFPRVLYALGLPGVGYVTAEALAMHFGSIEELQEQPADPEKVEEVDGVGPKMAVQIAEALADERTEALIEKLGEKGLRLSLDSSERRRTTGPLVDKTLVLTGTLPELTRDEAARQDQGRGRQGDRLGLEENRLRRRRREPRLEAGQGGEPRGRDPRRRRPAATAREG